MTFPFLCSLGLGHVGFFLFGLVFLHVIAKVLERSMLEFGFGLFVRRPLKAAEASLLLCLLCRLLQVMDRLVLFRVLVSFGLS